MKSLLGSGTSAVLPHATIEPSRLRPRLWPTEEQSQLQTAYPPAATAINPSLGSGTLHSPVSFPPHATIEPSCRTPRLWPPPAATAMNPRLGAGTLH